MLEYNILRFEMRDIDSLYSWLINTCDKLRTELNYSSYNCYEKMKTCAKLEVLSETLSKLYECFIVESHLKEIQEIEERNEEKTKEEDSCAHIDDCIEAGFDPLLMSVKMLVQYCKSRQECESCKFYDDDYAGCMLNMPAPYNWDLELIQKKNGNK